MLSDLAVKRRSLPALELPASIVAEGRHAIALRWVLSRALVLAILVYAREDGVSGDVSYYATSLHQLFSGAGLGNTLQEYPLPVLLVLLPPFLLGALNQVAFTILFTLSMLLVDAGFTGLLWRGDGRRRGDAVNLWLWFVPALGPLAYFRFDLVPAVLAGGAVLAAIRRPRLAGVLTALGAALKLWPVVMLPTFLLRRSDRRPVLLGFVLTGLVVGGLSLAIGGPRRTLSPLHWQSARGLQIESIAATPLMVARAVHP
ncbi:MAG TPA: glycosyltransferase family 87 protein, partial [Jatrophihabitans sp.]|nr:glycosyltransferase family 87 protein [Jatrophihabitans sp.]